MIIIVIVASCTYEKRAAISAKRTTWNCSRVTQIAATLGLKSTRSKGPDFTLNLRNQENTFAVLK